MRATLGMGAKTSSSTANKNRRRSIGISKALNATTTPTKTGKALSKPQTPVAPSPAAAARERNSVANALELLEAENNNFGMRTLLDGELVGLILQRAGAERAEAILASRASKLGLRDVVEQGGGRARSLSPPRASLLHDASGRLAQSASPPRSRGPPLTLPVEPPADAPTPAGPSRQQSTRDPSFRSALLTRSMTNRSISSLLSERQSQEAEEDHRRGSTSPKSSPKPSPPKMRIEEELEEVKEEEEEPPASPPPSSAPAFVVEAKQLPAE